MHKNCSNSYNVLHIIENRRVAYVWIRIDMADACCENRIERWII